MNLNSLKHGFHSRSEDLPKLQGLMKLRRLASLVPILVTWKSFLPILKKAKSQNGEDFRKGTAKTFAHYPKSFRTLRTSVHSPTTSVVAFATAFRNVSELRRLSELEESSEIVQGISRLRIQFCFILSSRHCIQSKTQHNRSLPLSTTLRFWKRANFNASRTFSKLQIFSRPRRSRKLWRSYNFRSSHFRLFLLDNTRPPTLLHSRKQFWGDFGVTNY